MSYLTSLLRDCVRLEQVRYWIFKAGETPLASWQPTDSGAVNLSSPSNLTSAYPFKYELGALGKNLTLSNLAANQSGRYWCVSYAFDYQNAAPWDLGVCPPLQSLICSASTYYTRK